MAHINFETIDHLVKYYRDSGWDNKGTIDWIIFDFPIAILEVLQSDTNVPSEHDITIIHIISKESKRYRNRDLRDTYNSILDIYKNRK